MAHIVPPFTTTTALEKVKFAQKSWNTKDPETIAKGYHMQLTGRINVLILTLSITAYTTDCIWRNRDQFIRGPEEIKAFLTKKFAKEQGYRLKKELFAFQDNKIVSLLWSLHACRWLAYKFSGCPVFLWISRWEWTVVSSVWPRGLDIPGWGRRKRKNAQANVKHQWRQNIGTRTMVCKWCRCRERGD